GGCGAPMGRGDVRRRGRPAHRLDPERQGPAGRARGSARGVGQLERGRAWPARVLPLADPSGEAERMMRVLVVADDPSTRRLIGDILEAMDDRDEMAGDGGEALERVRDEPPDAIVLDLRLPGMSGQEFLAACRDDPCCRDVPVLLLAAAGEEARDLAQTNGA